MGGQEKLAEFTNVCRLFLWLLFVGLVVVAAVLAAEVFSVFRNTLLAIFFSTVVTSHSFFFHD